MHKELTLSCEWEVVLLNAFSKLGRVFHEKEFRERTSREESQWKNYKKISKPDIYFETFANSHHNFVADITAISDKGLDKNNPYKTLSDELYKRVKESGLNGNSFSLRVGSQEGSTCKGEHKVKLKIPAYASWSKIIFNEYFNKFLNDIIKSPNMPISYPIKTSDSDIEISYNPGQKYSSGGHPSYTGMQILTENRIHEALEEKASQLRRANFKGPLGICLCDGGYSAFKDRPSWFAYAADEVIQAFLKQNKEISFIVSCTVIPQKPYSNFRSMKTLFWPLVHIYEGFKFDRIDFDLRSILIKLSEVLPKPERSPQNALNILKGRNPDKGRSNWGGMELSATKIKISARALLELLAGEVEQKKFFQDHGFNPPELIAGGHGNPFKNALIMHQLIEKISIEKMELEDDDWITFELKGPDPAISPFVAPR